ncbi:MAG: alpha-isopropylmalate synthase regulatory domain-containing protein, partial [Ketobacter sp.]
QIALSRVVQGDAEQSSGEISSQRVWALFQQHFMAQSPMSIKSYRLEHIENEQISFTVDYRGELVTIEAIGNGAISAFCNGLNQHFGLQLDVLDYEEHSLQHSSESQAAACVQINCLGSRHQGAAVHDDTLLASMNAIVSAVNAALAQQSTQVA